MNAASIALIVLPLSTILFIANLAGLLRWPHYADRAAATLSHDPIFGRSAPFTSVENFRRNVEEPAAEYAQRLTNEINRCFVHYIDKASPNVPFTQNWILWTLGWLPIGFFKRYEFICAERALHRGFGACSQSALILVDLARRNALPAHVLRFPGHVITEISTGDGTSLICDADYGVVLPGPAASLARRHNEIDVVYSARTGREASNVAQILTSEFHIFDICRIAPRQLFENAMFVSKWIIPVGGIVFGFVATM